MGHDELGLGTSDGKPTCDALRRQARPSPEEILNLITRGRHLGLTTFFITNTPAQLPEVVFRQIDNIICTGLGHSGDLRTVAKSALSDEDTLQSLAVGLRMTEALIVGRLTEP